MGTTYKIFSTLLFLAFLCQTVAGQQTYAEKERKVASIFESTCAEAGCHGGTAPQMGMRLTRDRFYSHTVNVKSTERPDLNIIHPGKPDSSYLYKKIIGADDIVGEPMPRGRERLEDDEVAAIRSWIEALEEADTSRIAAETRDFPKYVHPFRSWNLLNIPTNRTLEKGRHLFLISHRFVPPLSSGYDRFYGIDGSANIFLNFGYAITDNLLVNIGRSNVQGNVEVFVKQTFLRQQQSGGSPIGIGVKTSLNWNSRKQAGEDRFKGNDFKWAAQAIFTRKLPHNTGLAVVPGILVNPAPALDNESPLLTLGLGARWRFYQNLTLIGEWSPIFAGFVRTNTFGNTNRFDTGGFGLEIGTGGHIFQIVLTNSAGLTTDQYMRGGDLNIVDDLRLGFSIYRILDF